MKRTQFQKVSVRPIQIISYRTRFLAETLRKKIIFTDLGELSLFATECFCPKLYTMGFA